MNEKIIQCRDQIDQIDNEMLQMLNQRAALAQQIGHLKDNGVVLRPEREAQVLQRLQTQNHAVIFEVTNLLRKRGATVQHLQHFVVELVDLVAALNKFLVHIIFSLQRQIPA